MQPSFEWTDALWILVFVLIVALFVGPGMWSSSTNTLAKDMWLAWKKKKSRAGGESQAAPPAPDAVTGPQDGTTTPESGGTPSTPRTK